MTACVAFQALDSASIACVTRAPALARRPCYATTASPVRSHARTSASATVAATPSIRSYHLARRPGHAATTASPGAQSRPRLGVRDRGRNAFHPLVPPGTPGHRSPGRLHRARELLCRTQFRIADGAR